MEIELAYAAPDKQILLYLDVPQGTTIQQAIEISQILTTANIDYPIAVGIFGKIRSLDWALQAGDRLELYRPLHADPKEARLKRAKVQHKARAKLIQAANIEAKNKRKNRSKD